MVLIKKGEHYEGSSRMGEMIQEKIVEKQNNIEPVLIDKYTLMISSYPMLSMLYIVSKRKPIKVTLHLNNDVFGICEGDNIKAVFSYKNFEEFGGEIECSRNSNPKQGYKQQFQIPTDYNIYRIVMFGKDGDINCRHGFETEAYFFPSDRLPYNGITISVFFGKSNIKSSISNLIDYIRPYHVYLISEHIMPSHIFYMRSLIGDEKTVHIVAGGTMTRLAGDKEMSETLIKRCEYDYPKMMEKEWYNLCHIFYLKILYSIFYLKQ